MHYAKQLRAKYDKRELIPIFENYEALDAYLFNLAERQDYAVVILREYRKETFDKLGYKTEVLMESPNHYTVKIEW